MSRYYNVESNKELHDRHDVLLTYAYNCIIPLVVNYVHLEWIKNWMNCTLWDISCQTFEKHS